MGMLQRYGRPDERAPLYETLSRVLPPYDPERDDPKLIAARGKTLIGQSYGNLDKICEMYISGLERHPNSAMLANNVAVCHLRDPSTVPLSKPLFDHALQHAHLARELQSIQGNLREM